MLRRVSRQILTGAAVQSRSCVFVILMGLGLALAAQTDLEKASHLLKTRPAEAQAVLERIIQAEPRNAEAMALLGETHLRLRNAPKAQECADKALKLDPTRAATHCLRANALGAQIGQASLFKKMSMANDIRREYEKALHLDPRNREAREGIMQFYLQAPGIAGGGVDKAAGFAQQTVGVDPALGHSLKAMLHQSKKDLGAAQAEYRLAIAADPRYVPAYNAVGYVELEMKQTDLALDHFRKQVVLEPENANSYDSLGDGLLAKGQVDEAIAAYRRATVLDPGFSVPFYHLGKALERKGQGAEAVAQYRRAAGLHPEDRYIRLAKGRLAALGQK